MVNPTTRVKGYRFGDFEVDIATGELKRHGHRIKLQKKPFELLLLLLQQPGELVTRERASEVLWDSDVYVDFEHGLGSALNRLRTALGDSASRPTYIETLSGRGFRWLAPVDPIYSTESPTRASSMWCSLT